MFGYVLVNKPELRIREFDTYRSYYCGLCHTLGDRHGLCGKMTLTYDMTFLVMLLSDLYDEEDRVREARCIIHPVHKHCVRQNTVTEYCADMGLLLSYYKCLDDWQDDKKVSARVLAELLKIKCKPIEEQYQQKARFIKEKLNELNAIESEEQENGISHIDRAARVFGEIMAEIFVYKDDQWKEDLYKVGFYLGKYVYLLDAYEDIEDDVKKDSYNPFVNIYKNSNFEDQVLSLLMMMIGECTDAFERLPIVENIEIMRNILYSGVWGKFGKAKIKSQQKERKGNSR